MLKRWSVHHGAQDLGLMTAKEIRDALRRGTLDPFDKVSAEGSNIREDLIEVDEIFKEDEGEESTSSTSGVAQAVASPTADGNVPLSFPAQAPIASSIQIKVANTAPLAKGHQAAAMEAEEAPRTNPPPNLAGAPSWRTADAAAIAAAKEDKDSKSTQKRYYLIDKTKILGPVSALEIQSLFNRGGLNQKVKVQRIGGTKAIPISQFIASFSEDRIKELTEDGKLNQKVSSPSSKVLNELARAANAQKIAKNRKNKTYLILAIAGFLFGAAILVILDSSSSSKRTSEHVENESKKGRPKLLQRPQEDDDSADKETIKPRPKPQVAAPPKVARPAPEARETKEPRRPQATRTPTRTRAPDPEPKAAPVVERKPVAQPKPKVVAVVKPKAPEPPAKRESPIERALSSGGGVQTVGPLTFSITALETCPSKCTLTLRDTSGLSIKAVFFKSAYYDQLKKSGGNVFISGTVRREGSGATILIQDVR